MAGTTLAELAREAKDEQTIQIVFAAPC